jgi:non-canonical poly(A) RNA polymerase PAPD5/7
MPVTKVCCTAAFGKTNIDLTIQDGRHNGLHCVRLIKDFLREYKVLEPMVLVLKEFLKISGFNDPYTGGLSSYGLILIVVSFLQERTMQFGANYLSSESPNLGKLILDFLFYYGFYFSFNEWVIHVQSPGEKLDTASHYKHMDVRLLFNFSIFSSQVLTILY